VVINQVNKVWGCTKETMDAYCGEVRKLEKYFEGLEILHVVRDLNITTDVLAKLGSDRAQVPPGIFVEELTSPSIKQPEHVTSDTPTPSAQVLAIVPSWAQVFIDYIKEHKLPANKGEAAQVVRRSKNYVLVGDQLYRRGVSSGVLLKCIIVEEGKELLDEIHSGCCGNHAASRALVKKAFRSRFYWPTALKDTEDLVRHCKGCQMFARQAHIPAHNLIYIPPARPFSC
jgi:hypothetical protein